ncbi:MAG TPA: transaldolase [Chloroflexi bacterium]|nr:transaldolase [Chloroflexota bacterium]
MNPLVELYAYGQSFWYDNIRRKFLLDGTVQQLIEHDGLRGMTSNPSIFEKAIGHSDDYDEQIQALALDGADVTTIYEAVAIADIQTACDLFAFLYEGSGGGDGYVSLEVSPHLARDTEGTIADARRLFAAVNRPNLMIKVPATPEGIPAIRQLIGEGININVTLMFSMAHYEAVAGAYIEGLAQWVAGGGDPQQVASVASFFVSRVDTAVDRQLNALDNPAAQTLLGKVAVANSKVVYQRFKEIFHGETFAALQAAGSRRQRLLWASTSTKNPAYRDTLYVDELIGPETVNTMPPNTIEAFRDHGRVANTLEANVTEAQAVLDELAALGVDLNDITEQLQVAGVASFSQSFDTLMDTIAAKRNALANA